MRTAKSYKILTLIMAFALSLLTCFLLAPANEVNGASNTANPVEYFAVDSKRPELVDNKLVFALEDNSVITFTNDVVISDFEMGMSFSDNVKSATYILYSDSYVNSLDSSATALVENKIVVDFTAKTVKVNENAEENYPALTRNVNLSLSVVDGDLVVGCGAETYTETTFAQKILCNDKAVASISVAVDLIDTELDATASLIFVDQGKSVEGNPYKQTFNAVNGEVQVAAGRSVISKGLKVEDGKILAVEGKKYTVTVDAYTVIGKLTSAFVASEDAWLENSEVPTKVAFNSNSTVLTVKDANGAVEDYELTIISGDENAPVYNYNEKIVEDFKKAINNAIKENVGTPEEHYVRLGKTITIPSDFFRGLVEDDTYDFDDLTHTVYYKTPTSENGTTSGWNLTLTAAGDYEFYVVFKDPDGNTMKTDDFYTMDKEDSNKREFGVYGGYVFSFHVEDDAEIVVSAPNTVEKWYIGVSYKSSAFQIQSSGYTPKYKLYFNANENAEENSEGWIEIPKHTTVKSEYDDGNFTYDEIKEIAYDGQVTFKPIRRGAYKLVCTVNSTQSVKNSSAFSIIKVTEKATTVKPGSNWIENNVWSVVFLGVGTLSLIGIIALLFVKPKTNAEDDE